MKRIKSMILSGHGADAVRAPAGQQWLWDIVANGRSGIDVDKVGQGGCRALHREFLARVARTMVTRSVIAGAPRPFTSKSWTPPRKEPDAGGTSTAIDRPQSALPLASLLPLAPVIFGPPTGCCCSLTTSSGTARTAAS